MQYLSDYKAPCKQCDRRRYIIQRQGMHAKAQRCKVCFDTCPLCAGAEYTFVKDEQGYRYAKRCGVCGALDSKLNAYNNARIPAHYHSADFGNFDVQRTSTQESSHFDSEIGNLSKIRTQLFRWVQTYASAEPGFLLYGRPGSGKTHLMAAVVRHLTLEKSVNARFIEFTHLLGELRTQFDKGKGDTNVIKPLIDAPVLAIDELGKGVNNEWQLSVLDELISKRYNQNKTTIFTSNFMVEPQGFKNTDVGLPDFTRSVVLGSLQERVGDRIFSRLFEMTTFVHVDAPDYRRENQGQPTKF